VNFSIILDNAPRYSVQFTKAFTMAKNSLEAGGITNLYYKDTKDTLNRALEEAWKNYINERFLYSGKYQELPSTVYEFENKNLPYAPQIHTIPGYLRKVQTTPIKHPMIDAMKAFLLEAAPLSEMYAKLKTMIVKRQPKPVEDRKAKYNAPGASKTAVGIVKKLLEEITENAYLDLTAFFEKDINRKITTYLNAQQKAREEGKYLSLYNFYGDRDSKFYNPNNYELVSRFVESTRASSAKQEFQPKPNMEALVARLATDNADEVRENFIYKNLEKIDSIVEAKGNFKSAKIIGREVELGALRGTLKFEFEDTSSFIVQNSVVWSHSVYGKQFMRFPLTFHSPIMPNGTVMPRPSEERMNTVFVEKV
jgi:hypothetical protein